MKEYVAPNVEILELYPENVLASSGFDFKAPQGRNGDGGEFWNE